MARRSQLGSSRLAGLLAVASVVLATAGCKKKRQEDRRAQTPAPMLEVVPAVEPSAKARPIRVLVDGTEVAKVAPGELARPRPVAEIVADSAGAPENWLLVEAVDGRDWSMTLRSLAARNPDREARLYLDRDGMQSFGLFKPGVSAPTLWQRDVRRLVIRTVEIKSSPSAKRNKLEITLPDGRTIRAGPGRLAAVETIESPGGDGNGWSVRQIAAHFASGKVARVRLYGAESSRFELSAVDLANAGKTAFIKYNRRGKLRFKMWVLEGKRQVVTDDLRDVTRIEILR